MLHRLKSYIELFWINSKYRKTIDFIKEPIKPAQIEDAQQRLLRFAPFLASAFTDTKDGIIESPLTELPSMQDALQHLYAVEIPGKLFLKRDSDLPISGSIKARGGIYEVLKHAEALAINHGLLDIHDNYKTLLSETCKQFYSHYSIAVGSTGNLGLSIGIIGAKLGFQVTVHMSADAKQWKKDLLRSKGVIVKEYEDDYSYAVREGRKQAANDPACYFIDDENSEDLFLGYATAAARLAKQLKTRNIQVDEQHPLFVYLPCGVGGAPGGITYGLKAIYGANVHCFFAEPTHSPSMLLGLATGLYDSVSVKDIGIDNITAADGLAVGRPSGFVSKLIHPLVSGAYTISDDNLFKLLATLKDTEQIELEPSALAGLIGPVKVMQDGCNYIQKHHLDEVMPNATHIVWGTGGSMVPREVMDEYYERGSTLLVKE